MIVAVAATQLMHSQRARAINHAELAMRVSYRLSLTSLVGGSFSLTTPCRIGGTDAQNVWAVNRVIYYIWASCMSLFITTDAVVVCAVWRATGGSRSRGP